MFRRAFLVGINKYENPKYDLQGCVNDVFHMQNTLKIFGYEVNTCLDEHATKEGILSGLKTLINNGEESYLVFYYSGHGSQIVRKGADVDEIDNIFEVLCPFDVDFANKRYIMDKELIDIFNQLPPKTHLDVILDCCYSGSAARNTDAGKSENTSLKVRCISPIDYDDLVLPTLNKMLDIRSMKVGIKVNINYVVWSACKENQKSTERYFEGVGIRGIFTYYFCNAIAKSPDINRKTIDDRITKQVENIVKEQTPLMQYSGDFQLYERAFG